ncbi:MAG: phytanoyl-CoA dioxygenase family protein [Acidimicrobiales bacterium]
MGAHRVFGEGTVADAVVHFSRKDKLNHKLSGGAGYAAHQDAPTDRFVDVHVSCMVAIDDATVATGCLEVVSGAQDRLGPVDEVGCIRADVATSIVWEPVPVRVGDVLWFHSRTPRRSGPNPPRPGRSGRCTRRQRPLGGRSAGGVLPAEGGGARRPARRG